MKVCGKMKFEIDTDKLNWIEVPDLPHLGSFLSILRNPGPDRKEIAKLGRITGPVLVKYYGFAELSTEWGYVQQEPVVCCDLINIQNYDINRWTMFGPEKVIAFSLDFAQNYANMVRALERKGLES
jgi:hypothetical protein